MLTVMIAALVFLTTAGERRKPVLSADVENLTRAQAEVVERTVVAPGDRGTPFHPVVVAGESPHLPPLDNSPQLVPQTGWPGSSRGAAADDLPHA